MTHTTIVGLIWNYQINRGLTQCARDLIHNISVVHIVNLIKYMQVNTLTYGYLVDIDADMEESMLKSVFFIYTVKPNGRD